jgi:hypothetical protein
MPFLHNTWTGSGTKDALKELVKNINIEQGVLKDERKRQR